MKRTILGYLRIIEPTFKLGGYLIVGVSTYQDDL